MIPGDILVDCVTGRSTDKVHAHASRCKQAIALDKRCVQPPVPKQVQQSMSGFVISNPANRDALESRLFCMESKVERRASRNPARWKKVPKEFA
jgi:hypothetical protein